MKRVFVVLLCSIALFSFSTACSTAGSTSESAKGKITLQYWTLFGGGDAEYMQQIVDKFNKTHPNIHVNNMQLDSTQYYTKLVSGVAAGRSPDVAISHITMMPELENLGILSPVDDIINETKVNVKWDDFNQNILKSSIFNGEHYSLPIDTHPFVMFYNKKYLKEAGLLDASGNPIIGKGPDGFLNFLQQLKEKLPDDVAPFSLSNGGDDPYRLWWALYFQQGAEGIVSKDLQRSALDMDKAIKAAQFIKDLYFKQKFIPRNIADFYQMFQTQKAAITMTGVWATGTWASTKGLDFGAMNIPNIFGKQVTWGDSHNLIFPVQKNPDPKKQKAALEFAKFVEENGQMWAQAGHVPANTTNWDKPDFTKLPYRKEYTKVASTVAFPRQTAEFGGIKDFMMEDLDTIWNGSVSPERAFKKLNNQINDLLKNSILK
ncbi:multiple sugar transport system substrate-binding protein [Pullulanibacillus pueri]|uniref:Sugar ABC transporter substrate-binding protein n=1 Tax=Pullulanibacillus pueri TaxID=1437324 RepID=A0A8J2ZX68_9BACL|nr:ABC transporter substrate-binding protein [Pullulanibacillus pueri]MBM7682892.1 multiple sugar transport system substrate-binding protein [Pullulanibacillus pueri]GGH84406.1 sugar ABC transporter substrate-binding protein [Pullulanibacillus pueri]